MYLVVLALAIVAAGVAGCVATNLFANWIGGVPLWAIARQPGKHLWSVIFAVPLPILTGLFGEAGVFCAFAWLVAAPTIASKTHFGPKDAPWTRLLAFHSGYALAAIAVFAAVLKIA